MKNSTGYVRHHQVKQYIHYECAKGAEKEKVIQSLFKEILTEIIANCEKEMSIQMQEASKIRKYK